MSTAAQSWARWPRVRHRAELAAPTAAQMPALAAQGPLLAYGNGRSYGDVCLNEGGVLLRTAGMDQILAFDAGKGVVEVEAGVLLSTLTMKFMPQGWGLPVTPGTAAVTVGGAIANDVHGKNHHRLGSFGHHVLSLDLLRSDGTVEHCSVSENPERYAATIGGLGLTGLILRARLQLRHLAGGWIRGRSQRFFGLDEFFALSALADARAEYTVAWLDCLAGGTQQGRGVFMEGNHDDDPAPLPRTRALSVPFTPPFCPINRPSLRAFNWLYFRRPAAQQENARWHYHGFFHPLDSIRHWNRMYGPRGFFQFQCVVPPTVARDALRQMLDRIAVTGQGSFLSVLKLFGDRPSPGLMSFPRAGATLALDFPNRGERTLRLLADLERITCEARGAVYPAKDACMSARAFAQYFPRWEAFAAHVDPAFSSSFWRRVTDGLAPTSTTVPAQDALAPLAAADPSSVPLCIPAPQGELPMAAVAPSQSVVKPKLLSVEDAKSLDAARTAELFSEHMNPGQLHFLKLLGFHKVLIQSASGMYYADQNGRKILDFFGGFGSLAFGHNHPRIVRARIQFQNENRHEIAMAFLSQYAATLAKNLATISPGDLDMVFMGSTGSEVVEAGLKLAERAAGPERSKVAFAENSFHGKTRGALSVTDGSLYRAQFKMLDNTVRIPFGDAAALEQAVVQDRSIGAVILETIQGGAGIVIPPDEYFRAVRRICDSHGVLWIADEVQCGLGRSGRFYAFEHAGVVPDITMLAKSMGGGKCAMAAMIARRSVYMKAYGQPKNAMIHAPATFGGIGEACCTAIEALNVLYDEGLIENAAAQGDYLLGRLDELKSRYPTLIKEVRGRGLMIGIEFTDFSQTLPMGIRQMVALLDDKLKGSICGFVGAILLARHNVLVAFTEYNRNVVRLEPPLICQREHVDEFITALDAVLARGITGIVTEYLKLRAE